MKLPFVFDNSFIGSGLTFNLSRACTGTNYDGSVSLPNTPRYGPEAIIYGAPDYTAIDSSGTVARKVFTAGRRQSGSPFLCYQRNGAGFSEFIIADGTAALENINNTQRKYTFNMYDTAKGNNRNLLRGQTGTYGTRDFNEWAFEPEGSRTYKDLIFVICDVLHSPGWNSRRIACLWADMRKIVAGVQDPWQIWFVDDLTSDTDANRGADWCVTLTEDGNSAWIGISDYRGNGVKSGYHAIVGRVDYDPITDIYDLKPPVQLDAVNSATNMHLHFVHNTIDNSDNKIRSFLSVGDSSTSNHMVMFEIDKNAQYWSYATGIGGTGTLYQVYSKSSAWSPRAIVHSGSGSTLLGAGNQVVVAEPGPTPDTFYCGADESADGILLGYYDKRTGQMGWKQQYIPTVAAKWTVGTLQFSIVKDNDNVYSTRTVSPSETVANDQSVIVGSPNNKHFGVVGVHRQVGGVPIAAIDNGIYYGNLIGKPRPATKVTPGGFKIRKPLVVAPTTWNYLNPNLSVGSVGTNNNVTRLPAGAASLPSYVPKPPCAGPIYEIISTSGANFNLGIYTITPANQVLGIDSGMLSATVKGWMLPIPVGFPTGVHQPATGYNGRNYPSIGGRISPNADATAAFTLAAQGVSQDPTQWVPMNIRALTGQFANTNQISSGWGCTVQLRTPATAANISQLYFAWESVGINENFTSRCGHSPSGAGSTEIATVSGFSCGDRWAVGVAGMLHYDQYDHYDLPTGYLNFFRVNDGAKSVALFNTCIHNGTIPVTGLIGLGLTDGSFTPVLHNYNSNLIRGVPVTAVFNYTTGHLDAYYCVANDIINKFSMTGLNIQPKSISFGDTPLAVFGGGVSTVTPLTSGEINTFFKTLEFSTSQPLKDRVVVNANIDTVTTRSRGVVRDGNILAGNVNRPITDSVINGVNTVGTSGFIPASGKFLSVTVTKSDFRIDKRKNDNAADVGKRAVVRSGHRNIVDTE